MLTPVMQPILQPVLVPVDYEYGDVFNPASLFAGGEEPLPDPIGMIIDLTEDSAPLPEPVGMTVDLNVTITTP